MAGYQPPGNLGRAQRDLCAAENDPIKFSSKLPSTKLWCALTAKWLRTDLVERRWPAWQELTRLLSLQILVSEHTARPGEAEANGK